MKRFELLYKDENKNTSIYLDKRDGNIKICTPGQCISKPIEKWIIDDTTYANRVLVNRINELERELDKLKNKS